MTARPTVTRLQREADAAMSRYTSTCELGGTPEQRTWAWAHANAALDDLIAAENAPEHARANRATEELEAA